LDVQTSGGILLAKDNPEAHLQIAPASSIECSCEDAWYVRVPSGMALPLATSASPAQPAWREDQGKIRPEDV